MSIAEEDREILVEFINESSEALEKTEVTLLKLEDGLSQSDNIDPKIIDDIFRTFHSIKGSAGFIGLQITNAITHVAENLLDLIRKGKTVLSKSHIDIFLELCDVLQMMLEHIQSTFTEDGFKGGLDDLKSRLKKMVDGDKPEKRKKSEPVKETKKPKSEESTPNMAAQDAFLTPEMIQQFISETQELIDSLEQDLLELEKNPDAKELTESAFRSLHSIKGNSGLFNYRDIQQVCHKAESFLDTVRAGEVEASSKQISLILQVLDFISKAVGNLADGRQPLIAGKVGLLDLMDDMFGIEKEEELEEADKKDETAEEEKQEETEHKESKNEVVPKLEKPQKQENQAEISSIQKPKTSEVIRVDVNKLNQLMDLVGEIVVAESMVSQNPALADSHIEELEKSLVNLQKNVRDLQELATAMRMIPLSGLFSKMKRLVRDISGKSNKKVDLEITGGETEVDRSVLESISDPLVHILRNSIDHGIEPTEDRKAKGKRLAGKVVLNAKRVGGEIWIEIIDDGAGLNKDKIKKKAIEKGLLNDTDEDIPDEKIYQMIFTAGFSTAAKVTNISGRGVGMDVVRRNIEKIRGRIDVSSKIDEGTTIILKIPLTTAIIDGMLMRVGNSVYAIPTLDIKESLQVNDENVVELVDGQEVINIREVLIPVLRLDELHNIENGRKSLADGIVVVAENAGKLVGFLVDDIIGQQQLVIKNLSDYVGNIRGVSGCSVLGDGSICLILDLGNMVKLAQSESKLEEVST